MQCKARKNFDASRDRSLLVFGVGFAFINESTIYPVSSQQLDDAIEDMKLVSNLTPPRKVFHVIPAASIYSSDLGEGNVRLKELVNNVSEATGKEDLMLHLRILSLQKIALENGYTKLLLGSCTSMIACHVITGSLNTVEVSDTPHSGINGLVSSFVKLLQFQILPKEPSSVEHFYSALPQPIITLAKNDNKGANTILLAFRQRRWNLNLPFQLLLRINLLTLDA
ncbi:hypothetical protein Vadar_025317 [Vaccinium darrowii]|uniref:Uncharacterized protein n=1 Tax=Vaccinium darrowii TaxID=229202 RepID=A0ACB7YPM3_9ERIC|nr:hypothetical protein Vadar_025317 [Vaccinium darrowii]